MAKVKFYKINNSVLSSLPIVEGQLIFVQDTGKIYIDKDNLNRVEIAGNTDTQLAQSNTVYYLTGVTTTAATQGDHIYNTRLSNTYTGVKYETSNEGGKLSVDDREVTLGLYYEIS